MDGAAPSRAVIDLEAYAHNLHEVRRIIGKKVGIAAVVKANAYGHGLAPVAQRALQEGAAMLAVATVEEGMALRAAGLDGPILVMVQPGRDALPEAVAHRLTVMIGDVRTAEALGQLAHRAKRVVAVHCKIDTGMGRQGFDVAEAREAIEYITRISHIDIEGIATHFCSADIPEDTYTMGQVRAFRHLLRQLERSGIPYEVTHAANSAALLNYHASHFDLVRPGLMTYGVGTTVKPAAHADLRPVLSWRTRVIQVRHFKEGSSVGYGRTYVTPAPMTAAVLPVGYADGYRHALSNRADVLIRGRRCPVRGAVSMDQILVETTHLGEVRAGDTATLIGADGDERITAEELARAADTIPYEILAGIGPRVAREYA